MTDDLVWLAEALATGHPADEACRAEVVAGARVRLLGTSGGGNDKAWFVWLYGTRVEHLQRIGARFLGADVAERLAACNYEQVRIASVHGADNFVVFLAPQDPVIVATLGVDGSLANPDFTDW